MPSTGVRQQVLLTPVLLYRLSACLNISCNASSQGVPPLDGFLWDTFNSLHGSRVTQHPESKFGVVYIVCLCINMCYIYIMQVAPQLQCVKK